MSAVRLGDHARDSISGFDGVVVAITEWLHGCRRIALEPMNLMADGTLREMQWFDEQRVVPTPEAIAWEPGTTSTTAPGGPRPDPARGHSQP